MRGEDFTKQKAPSLKKYSQLHHQTRKTPAEIRQASDVNENNDLTCIIMFVSLDSAWPVTEMPFGPSVFSMISCSRVCNVKAASLFWQDWKAAVKLSRTEATVCRLFLKSGTV